MRGEPAGSTNKRTEPERIPNRPTCARVRGGAPPGLGHAVLVARELVGNEPFAVILADDVIDANPPAVRQLIDVFQRLAGPVLAGDCAAPRHISPHLRLTRYAPPRAGGRDLHARERRV